jgi:ankyrin repeat protein
MNNKFTPGNAMEGGAETELHAIAWAGNLRKARRLVRKRADVNYIDAAGETPLHGAAAWGHSSIVRSLLSVGAHHDIPAKNTNNLTPLHWAARSDLKL